MLNDSTWRNIIQHNGETYNSVHHQVISSIDTTFKWEIATKWVSESIDYSMKFEFEQVQQVLSGLMVRIGYVLMMVINGLARHVK